jgi:hypothetical protein
MVKRLLVALAMLVGSPAFASFVQPPDVPAFQQQTVHYAGPGQVYAPPTVPPPAYAYMPANIVAPNENAWLVCINGGTYPSCNAGTGYSTSGNVKFRTHFMTTHILNDDPVRNYGQPGTAHCHLFWGNRSTNAYSTYQTLRGRPRSRAAGGPINGSAYWAPCVILTNPFADGKNYVVRSAAITGYYENWAHDQSMVYIPRGFSFVSGANMDDPDDATLLAELAAANVGQPGRYTLGYNPDGALNHDTNWSCTSQVDGSTQTTTNLIKADGTDGFLTGWGGTNGAGYHQHCLAGDQMQVTMVGPPCWDGVNIWSPGGYLHVRHGFYDTLSGVNQIVCPDHWYHIPVVVQKESFTTAGWSGAQGYSNFKLSSDAAFAAKAGHSVAPVSSFHFDYKMGWDDVIFRQAEYTCAGANDHIPTGVIGNDCEGSQISDSVGLQGGVAPDGSTGNANQIDFSYLSRTTDRTTLFLLPSANYTGLRTHTTH